MQSRWGPVLDQRLPYEGLNGLGTIGTSNQDKGTASMDQEICVDLCVAVVKYKTKLQRDKVGLCSSYLSSLKVRY